MASTVLQLIETGGPGGAERMLVHLAAGLGPEYRAEAALIRDSWLGGALKERGVHVTMLRHRPQGSIATLRDLVCLIRKRQVAVLHAHEFFMNMLGLVASWLTGVPLVATVHERNYYPDRLRRRAAYRLVGIYCRQMVTVSEDLKSFLTARIGIPAGRIRVVPNGVRIDEEPSRARLAALRESLGLEEYTWVIGTVGRLHPKKGHRYLIESAAAVIRRFPGAVFLIVGRGELRDELEGLVGRMGLSRHFRFLGQREDVRELLATCDLFSFPSLSEGMPLALLEAMGAGLPCVATRIGGVTEVVEDGRTALLVPPMDSQALAEGMITLLQDRELARRIGGEARAVVTNRFSQEIMVQRYREIYSAILQGKNGCKRA